MSKMPCMNHALVTFINLGGLTYWINKDDIDGRGGPFKVTLPGLGTVELNPKGKIATDSLGRTTLITCKILPVGPDDFGVEVAIGNPKTPQNTNINAIHTKIFNLGMKFGILFPI